MLFDVCDPDLDPMTLVLKLDQDMAVTYLHANNEVNMSKGSKVMAWKHTHRQSDRHTCVTRPTKTTEVFLGQSF